MPQPDYQVRSTSRFAHGNRIGPGGIRSVVSGSMNTKYSEARKELGSHENRRVVSRATVFAGSLRVRSCKLLWKPAVLQLMVTSTTSLSKDESHSKDCDDDSDESNDNDIDKLTNMTRPNTTHHYSLVFCHRSLMGHARRERIELNGTRDLVEFIWGKDGMMSTRFEFSIVYGKRRRTLNCRASDAKDYLKWTEVLRAAVTYQGKKRIKMNRLTQTSSNASTKSTSSIESFCNASIVKEQEAEALTASTLTTRLPTNATAVKAIASPTIDMAEGSALRPVPANIAAVYGIGRRQGAEAKPAPQSVDTHFQRQEQSRLCPDGAKRHQGSTSMTMQTIAKGRTSNNESVELHHRQVTVSRPSFTGQRRQRSSNAARGRRSTRHVQKTQLSNSKPKRNDLRVLPVSKLDERLTNAYVITPSSSLERQQLQCQKSYTEFKSNRTEDTCLNSCQSCRVNVDKCNPHDIDGTRFNCRHSRERSWAAYVDAMECEF